MTLTLIRRHPDDPAAPRGAEFRAPGGTLGRGAENHLVLPDPAGRLCRVQAALRIDAQSCRLRNLSTMSAVSVNDVPLQAGREADVAPGDVLRIGQYVLDVEDVEDVADERDVPDAQDEPGAWDAAPSMRPMPPMPPMQPVPQAGAAAAAQPAGEDVFGGLFGPGTLPVGGAPELSAHPFDLDSAQSRNAVDPLAHLPPGGAPAQPLPRDPLALFGEPGDGAPDVFADATPSTLPGQDPLAPLRSHPVRDTLRPARNDDDEDAPPAGRRP